MATKKPAFESWRLEDYMAEDSEHSELLYAMHGFYGDSFDPSFEESKIAEHISSPEWCSTIWQLLQISSLYKWLSERARELSIEPNEFLSRIGQLIDGYLKDSYVKDLYEIEDGIKCLAHFNILLKYESVFNQVKKLLDEIEDNNECNIHSKLRLLLEPEVESTKNDVFLQMSAEYMLSGQVPKLSSQSFFISQDRSELNQSQVLGPRSQAISSKALAKQSPYKSRPALGNKEPDNCYTIDYTKWPEGVSQKNALIIQETGQFVRTLRSLGIAPNMNEYEIFDDSLVKSPDFYRHPTLFDDYINKAQKEIRLKHLESFNAETMSEILRNFHLFSLHRHEHFWFNLLDQRDVYLRQINYDEKPTTMMKVFECSLYLTYGYELGKEFLDNVSLVVGSRDKRAVDKTIDKTIDKRSVTDKTIWKDELLLMKLMFELPPIAELWLHRAHKKKYQTVFVYLTKLLQTRFALINAWKVNRRNVKVKRKMFLVHWSFRTLGSFYSFSKFQIEHRMSAFSRSCSTAKNIDEISQLHESILNQLTEDLYLNSKTISSLINDLIAFAWKLIRSLDKEADIEPEMMERFTCIRNVINRIFDQSNDFRSSRRFSELLRFY